MVDERVVLQQANIYRWNGPKRKATMFQASVGTLVLTTRRLLFYSAGNAMLGGTTSLEKPGALDCPTAALRAVELTSAWNLLTVTWQESSGEATATFGEKIAGMPKGPEWVSCLTQLRDDPALADVVEAQLTDSPRL